MAEIPDVAVQEAEGTSPESSTETETSTAQGTEKETSGDAQAGKDGKPSQKTASTDESEDDSKLPFNKHPRWQQVYGENKEMKATLGELKELGIESKEHAEFLRRGADSFEFVIDQIENRPEEFFRDFRQQYPQQYKAHLERTSTLATSDFLKTYADSYRRRGDKGDADTAELLDSLAEQARDGGKPKAEPARDGKDADAGREALQEDRYNFFAEQVTSEIQTVLTGKINELTKGVEFRNERQRTKFMGSVLDDVNGEMEKNPVFVRERNEAQSPRHGLGRGQRSNVVNLYARNATAGGRLERAVEENLSHMGLSGSTGGGKRNGKQQTGGRREITGSGSPTPGTVTKDAKESIKQDLAKQGLAGADLMKEYMSRMSKLRGQ